MVNRGPSAGCDTCRHRRIKCDEARPACQNCLRRGTACLGYRSLFDRAHRDVTDDTRRRCQKKSNINRTSATTSNSISPVGSSDISLWSTQSPSLMNDEIFTSVHSVPLGINQDYETAACDWFIAVFAEHPSSTRANTDFLLHLFPMVQRTSASSPLHRALSAVAVSFAGVVTRDFSRAEIASTNYASATKLLRKSIDDPRRSLDDDVLMTVLVLSFHDSVNGHFNLVQDSHESHLMGALALIDHRKSTNYKNEASKAMVNHVQNGLLQHALLCQKQLPASSKNWFKDSRLPRTCFRKLNEICRDLTDLLIEAEHIPECLEDTLSMTNTIEKLVQLDEDLVQWHDTLPVDCSPIRLEGEEISLPIRQTGVYHESCYVYKNLQTATMVNLWRSRRLMLLHRLRICVAISSFYGCISRPEGYEDIPSIIQSLVDGICETVPFMLGDVSRNKPAILAPDIHFPQSIVDGKPFPESYSNHVRHATVSGAWLMMEPFMLICHMTDTGNGPYAIQLKEGQLEWIKTQLRRSHQGIETCRCGKHIASNNL